MACTVDMMAGGQDGDSPCIARESGRWIKPNAGLYYNEAAGALLCKRCDLLYKNDQDLSMFFGKAKPTVT